MATLYATNATLATQNNPTSKVPVGDYGGRVRVCYDKYTLSAAFGASDVLTFGRLPKGAKVLNATVVCPDMGGTGTFDFGHTASVDAAQAASAAAFGDDVDWSGQALAYNMGSTIGFSALGAFKELAGEVDVILTLTGVTATTSGTIHVAVTYVID